MTLRTTNRKVYLAAPHYGAIHPSAIPGLMQPVASDTDTFAALDPQGASLLSHNFNRIYCAALNKRKKTPWTHFAMHHADIEAPQGWIDTLIDELDRVGADVISAIVAIKDNRGLTTTGVCDPAANNSIRRFTMREILSFPETFDAAGCGFPERLLMVNTGLWVQRFDQAWVEEFPGFEIRSRIVRHDTPEGPLWVPHVLSEDWNASGWWARAGLKVFATRKLVVTHHGNMGYPNNAPWGEWDTDQGDKT